MRRHFSYSVLAAVALVLVLSACGLERKRGQVAAAPGESVAIEERFHFYFDKGYDKYVPVRPEDLENFRVLILDGASWKTPPDVELESSAFDMKTDSVFAGVAGKDTTYVAAGIELRVSCTTRVAENASTGEHELFVELPGLAKVSNTLSARVVFTESDAVSSGTKIKVKELYV